MRTLLCKDKDVGKWRIAFPWIEFGYPKSVFFPLHTMLWLACAEYLLSGVASAHLRDDLNT